MKLISPNLLKENTSISNNTKTDRTHPKRMGTQEIANSTKNSSRHKSCSCIVHRRAIMDSHTDIDACCNLHSVFIVLHSNLKMVLNG